MDFVEGQDREQMFISSIEQMVEPEAFVRIIDAFIDALPLEQFDFKNLELNEQGRPPLHPGVLLKGHLFASEWVRGLAILNSGKAKWTSIA